MKSVIAAISAHSIVDSRIRVQKKQMIDFFKPAGPSPDRLILKRSYAGLAVDLNLMERHIEQNCGTTLNGPNFHFFRGFISLFIAAIFADFCINKYNLIRIR